MQVWVRFLSGGRRGETVPLNIPPGGAITVGRADDNHIVLPANVDVAASSHHCELRNQNNALVLVDTNSTNGTWVYGQRVTTVPLASGIRVTFGRGGPEAEIFFQPDAASAAPAAPSPSRTAPQMAVPGGFGAAPAAPAAIPKQGDPCGICSRPLGADMWMCYGCKKGLCASHYDANARTCVVCSGAQQAQPAQAAAAWGAPQQGYGAAPAASATDGGCEMCGAHDAPSFVCMGCTRCVCETHRNRQTGTCQDCATGGQPGGGGGGAGADGGCEICGAQAATSFVCMGCTRCVCETHRNRQSGTCQDCARGAGYR